MIFYLLIITIIILYGFYRYFKSDRHRQRAEQNYEESRRYLIESWEKLKRQFK